MNDIIQYYLDIWFWLQNFFINLYENVVSCIEGGDVEQLSVVIFQCVWLVFLLISLLMIMFSSRLFFPKMTWLFIVSIIPVLGAVALFCVEGFCCKALRKRGLSGKTWKSVRGIVSGKLVKVPLWCAIGFWSGAMFLKAVFNIEWSVMEINVVSRALGVAVLLFILPFAYIHLRKDECFAFLKSGDDKISDDELIGAVSGEIHMIEQESKPVIVQDDIEESLKTNVPDNDKYLGYSESMLKGLFLKEEEKVQYVNEDIYHVKYSDVKGQSLHFAVKSKSNLGVLLIAINTLLVLCGISSAFVGSIFKMVSYAIDLIGLL